MGCGWLGVGGFSFRVSRIQRETLNEDIPLTPPAALPPLLPASTFPESTPPARPPPPEHLHERLPDRKRLHGPREGARQGLLRRPDAAGGRELPHQRSAPA